MQGEQDAATNAAGDWATNAYNVMTALTNWIGGNPHIAICRISNGTGLTSRAYYSNVRTAQYTASTNLANASMISTDGFYTWDGTHFSGSGLIDLGNARLQNILNNAADLRVIGTLSAKSFVGDIGNTTVAGTNFQQYVVGLTEASTNLAGFFYVYLTTNHAVANASPTAIAFDAELDDTAGVHNAGAFTFPKGYVDAVIGYGWLQDADGAFRIVRRYKNGSLQLPDLYRSVMKANIAIENHTMNWRFYNDNATNVYRLYVYSDDPTAANRAVSSNSYVTGWTIQR
jgi:hypothetical protein